MLLPSCQLHCVILCFLVDLSVGFSYEAPEEEHDRNKPACSSSFNISPRLLCPNFCFTPTLYSWIKCCGLLFKLFSTSYSITFFFICLLEFAFVSLRLKRPSLSFSYTDAAKHFVYCTSTGASRGTCFFLSFSFCYRILSLSSLLSLVPSEVTVLWLL